MGREAEGMAAAGRYLEGLTDALQASLAEINRPGLAALTNHLTSGRANVTGLGAGTSAPLYPLWHGVIAELADAARDELGDQAVRVFARPWQPATRTRWSSWFVATSDKLVTGSCCGRYSVLAGIGLQGEHGLLFKNLWRGAGLPVLSPQIMIRGSSMREWRCVLSHPAPVSRPGLTTTL